MSTHEKYSFKTVKLQTENAMEKGDIKRNDMTPEEITHTIFSIVRGNILEWARVDCDFDINKRVNDAVEIFLKGLRVG